MKNLLIMLILMLGFSANAASVRIEPRWILTFHVTPGFEYTVFQSIPQGTPIELHKFTADAFGEYHWTDTNSGAGLKLYQSSSRRVYGSANNKDDFFTGKQRPYIVFTAEAGKTYTIESASSPDGVYTLLEAVTAESDGETWILDDTIADRVPFLEPIENRSRFYRITTTD